MSDNPYLVSVCVCVSQVVIRCLRHLVGKQRVINTVPFKNGLLLVYQDTSNIKCRQRKGGKLPTAVTN